MAALTTDFGNPGSVQHGAGRRAARLVEEARGRVACLLGADEKEVIFTSGATESINLALKGVLEHEGASGRHLITTQIEHPAVLDVAAGLEARGFEVTYLPVDAEGLVHPGQVAGAMRPDTALVSLQLANNEIGVVQPVEAIGEVCRKAGVLLHVDAAQALAHLDCSVDRLGVDLLSISAHKAHGPQGVGALYARRRRPRVRLRAQLEGGGQELGRRSGTLNVPGIAGFGKACELLTSECQSDATRVAGLRDRLLETLRRELPDLVVNGSLAHRLPNNINVSLPGVPATGWLSRLSTVACSAGSACSRPGSPGGSHVILGLGKSDGTLDPYGVRERARGAIRLGLGRFTTGEEIEAAATELVEAARDCLESTGNSHGQPDGCDV